MSDFDRIFQLLKENEAILRKFHLLESKILAILNLKDFFESLLTEMMSIFRMPYVWMTVIKNSKLAEIISWVENSDTIEQRINFIDKNEFMRFFNSFSKPLLSNSDLRTYHAFFSDGKIYPIRSIALAPVFIDGEIVGTLNQGDIEPSRFEANMDTSLLEQLMVKISLCLSNVLAHEKIQFFAYHDPLTELLNRRAFETEFQREFSRVQRHKLRLSLVFSDLDDFKRINDLYGHEAGDKALKYIADTIKLLSRKEDIISRFAGDEFVILLPETPSDKAENLMTRIKTHLDSHPLETDSGKLYLSLSNGIASTEDSDFTQPEQLLKAADKQLYAVKSVKKSEEARAKGFI